jgi:hypothetical protein
MEHYLTIPNARLTSPMIIQVLTPTFNDSTLSFCNIFRPSHFLKKWSESFLK